jgi:alpha-beta hydrolase superfamily lysophospholipase
MMRPPRSPRRSGLRWPCDRYRGVGLASIAHDFYQGGRHDMLHELNRRDVFTNLLVWIPAS